MTKGLNRKSDHPLLQHVGLFLLQGFRGSAKKKPLLSSVFPLLFFPTKKKQGLEGQGSSRYSSSRVDESSESDADIDHDEEVTPEVLLLLHLHREDVGALQKQANVKRGTKPHPKGPKIEKCEDLEIFKRD